ncbi:MAG: YfhO family protein [Paludibacteraceae bacterium]|nr:YfhO family protein [Paludibacteraceae bacterium]
MLIIPAGHMTKANAIGCLAPIIGGIYAVFRKNYWLGAPLIVIYGIIGITLHPQMTYYFLMLIGVMACVELYIHIKEKRWKDLGIGVGICVLCALLVFGTKLSWWQINNEYLKETMRGGHSELRQDQKDETQKAGLDIKYATDWSYGKAETLTLLIPNFMGGASGYNVGEKSVLYDELVKARVPKSSAKQFCQGAPTYWGEKMFTSGAVYVGAIICFLFVLGLLIVPGPYKWGLLFATIASILLAWGKNFMPLTEWFFYHFPMYNKFRAVESILVIAELTIPLLGFMGLQKLWESKEEKSKYSKEILIAGGITAGICLIVALFGGAMFGFTSSYDNQWKGQVGDEIYRMIIDQRVSMMKADAWRSFGLVVAAAVVVWLYIKDKLKSGYALGIIAALILVDLVPVDRRFFGSKDFVSKKDGNRYFAIQPWEEQILQDKSLDYRVLNLTANTFNDARTSYRLKSVGGYSAVKLRRYQDLIDEHISKMNWSVLNMLNTKYIVTQQGVYPNPDAMGNAWFVNEVLFVPIPDDESAALNTLDLRKSAVADELFREVLSCSGKPSEGDEIRLTKYLPDQLDYAYQLSEERVAVFSEVYYPKGWHLYCDGKEIPIGRVNYTLRAAVLPAGSHTLHMEFVPDALAIDNWCIALIIIGILLSIGSLAWPLYKKYIPIKQTTRA